MPTVNTVISHSDNGVSATVEFFRKGEADGFRVFHGGIARQLANAIEWDNVTQLAITAG